MTNSLAHEIGSALIAPDKLLFDPENMPLSTPADLLAVKGLEHIGLFLAEYFRLGDSEDDVEYLEEAFRDLGWRICEYIHPVATHAVMPIVPGRQAYLIDARSDAWMGQKLFDMRRAVFAHRICINPKLYLQRHNPSVLAFIEDVFTKLDGKGRCIVPWWVAQFKAATPEVKEVFFGLDSAYCAENLRWMDEQGDAK